MILRQEGHVFILLAALAILLISFSLPANAQQNAGTTVWGEITDIDYDSITIERQGEEVDVDTTAISEHGLDDIYEEGMYVGVEGTVGKYDEIKASHVKEGAPYTSYYTPVPPANLDEDEYEDEDERQKAKDKR